MPKLSKTNQILFEVMKQHNLSMFPKQEKKKVMRLVFDRIKRLFRSNK